jgi:hypothetical protein
MSFLECGGLTPLFRCICVTQHTLSQLPHSPRRSLAPRTKMAAPPGHHHPPYRLPAAKTLLSVASVNFMVLLIISCKTISVNKIRNRRPAHLNRFLQNFLQRRQQPVGFLSLQWPALLRRMNFCLPQTFIRINIPDSA